MSPTSPDSLTIRRPDDWHVHLRDGAMLATVLPFTARQFARAIIMPNLADPVTTPEKAAAYRRRIVAHLPDEAPGDAFQPLMTCYLTDDTDPAQLEQGFLDGVFTAAKLYPAHATTGSAHGVTEPLALTAVYETMQILGMPLLVHGEVTDPAVDIFDREAVFIDGVLSKIVRDFPNLRVVLEHVTTRDGIDFVTSQSGPVGATITAHHLLLNRNALFEGGIRPHYYCLPVAKREEHRQALIAAATSGNEKFFLGTDTAPHPIGEKESACGCAGIFTAPAALALYAEAFEAAGALDKLEAFASLNGPKFYDLEVNQGTVTLERAETPVPERIDVPGVGAVHPFRGGANVAWKIKAT